MATDPEDQSPAIELRLRLSELRAERLLAWSYGMTANATYMADLDEEIAEVTTVYTRAVVTEMAILRGELFGVQVG
jgi:hypothetical protein